MFNWGSVLKEILKDYIRNSCGEINNMIGMAKSNPYEPPINPDLVIDTINFLLKINW